MPARRARLALLRLSCSSSPHDSWRLACTDPSSGFINLLEVIPVPLIPATQASATSSSSHPAATLLTIRHSDHSDQQLGRHAPGVSLKSILCSKRHRRVPALLSACLLPDIVLPSCSPSTRRHLSCLCYQIIIVVCSLRPSVKPLLVLVLVHESTRIPILRANSRQPGPRRPRRRACRSWQAEAQRSAGIVQVSRPHIFVA